MLQQRINGCFEKAAPQRAGPTQTVILRRPNDFAKYTFCAQPTLERSATWGFGLLLLEGRLLQS
tara:strand:- start:186 stop:377 length:192 start_codon:yes stop_codon:yes gene_type:complete